MCNDFPLKSFRETPSSVLPRSFIKGTGVGSDVWDDLMKKIAHEPDHWPVQSEA